MLKLFQREKELHPDFVTHKMSWSMHMGQKKNFPDSDQGEEKTSLLRQETTVNTVGQLPDNQGEVTPGAWLFLLL